MRVEIIVICATNAQKKKLQRRDERVHFVA